MRRLILRSFQSPGDVLMLTAAVRDLHVAHPGKFQTDVRTSADEIWLNNPHLTPLKENQSDVEVLEMHYPLIHQCNQRAFHFIHGYPQYLEDRLNLRIPVTHFRGDVHLTADEKRAPIPGLEQGVPERFWIMVAGGKHDFTAKWWNPACYQQVVDHFRGRIQFVQCGEAGHWHPPLEGVVNLIGKTPLRDFVRLMHHADGVVCPVTFAMHLAAAVETKPERPKHRACVVIAGGREPPQWEAYPHHQFISTNGALPCCGDGGCWKSRCQTVGDGDAKDRQNLCEQPVQVSPELRIPKCLDMIRAEDVIRRIELYYQGGALQYLDDDARPTEGRAAMPISPTRPITPPTQRPHSRAVTSSDEISVSFYHGLGDCAYFAHLIPLYLKRGHRIAVECTPDKRLLFEAAGARVLKTGEAKAAHAWGYPSGGTHEGQGRFWQGSKMGHNISEPPLPNIGSKQDLWDEFVASQVSIESFLPAASREAARRWFDRLQRPIVLFHQKGNTAQARKSLPDAFASRFYETFINQCDGTLVLLDWDRRVPKLASHRIRHLDDLGPVPTDVMFSMMLDADLLIGVDSGPLHVARFTDIPTIGVWMPGHYPTTYTLPRSQQLNVVLAEHTRQWNRFKRIPWNILEHPGSEYCPERLAALTHQMLEPPRYLPKSSAADVQLRQFINEFCLCHGTSPLTTYWDRHRSFDVLLRETTARFEAPTIVETGTIREEEDWGGAGFFTYLAGAYLARRGGKLHSADLSHRNCDFARTWTTPFGSTVSIHEQDSVLFLSDFSQPIDVLYLDSLDTTEPGHADHAIKEFQAAEHRLHNKSLIVVDDTPWNAGAFIGKGARLVPHLLDHGWQILYAGYQVVLSRQSAQSHQEVGRRNQ